jgi:hypothetical protein
VYKAIKYRSLLYVYYSITLKQEGTYRFWTLLICRHCCIIFFYIYAWSLMHYFVHVLSCFRLYIHCWCVKVRRILLHSCIEVKIARLRIKVRNLRSLVLICKEGTSVAEWLRSLTSKPPSPHWCRLEPHSARIILQRGSYPTGLRKVGGSTWLYLNLNK